MTTDQFLSIIENLPIRWKLANGLIRSVDDNSCPLIKVAYAVGGTITWQGGRLYRPSFLEHFCQAGKILGISEREYHCIFRASDNKYATLHSDADKEMRLQLLAACSLENKDGEDD